MAHDTHHSSHGMGDGHDDHSDHTKAPHAGYFEVPLALGVVFWALILVIVSALDCKCDDACAEECGPEKTEMHSGH